MPYTDNIPQTGQSLGQTQSAVNTNFGIIRTVQKVNHVDYDAADQGKHNFLQMPNQASAPATAINELGAYAKSSTGSNLFLRSENSGSEYKMTAFDDTKFTLFATNTIYNAVPQNSFGGWTFLPGGLLLQYGHATITGTKIISYPKAFSLAPYSIQLTEQTDGSSEEVILNNSTPPTTTEMTVKNNVGSARLVYWVAIGPA